MNGAAAAEVEEEEEEDWVGWLAEETNARTRLLGCFLGVGGSGGWLGG